MHFSQWQFTLRDAAGTILDQSPWVDNVLTNEGAFLLMDCFFRNSAGSTPDHFEIGLTSQTPVATSTAALLGGEPSGSGYARQALPRNVADFPTLAVPTGSLTGFNQIVSLTKTFSATGGTIGPIASAFLMAQVGSGPFTPYLICAAGSSQTQIQAGSALDVTISLTLGAGGS